MPYDYMEHVSDIGIRASGKTLEEAFEAGAVAMLNAMFDIKSVSTELSVTFGVSAPDVPALFVETLNEILFIQDRHSLALNGLQVKEIKKEGDGRALTGRVTGEPFDPDKNEIKTEVKAATYSGLSYREAEGQHVLECVIDV